MFPNSLYLAARARVALALLLITSFVARPVDAQVLVTDTAAIASNEKNQALLLAKMVDQYTQMVEQYTAMLTDLRSLNLNVATIDNQLQPIADASSLVKQACPGATDVSGMASNLVGLNVAEMKEDIRTSQTKICQRITLLQIDKYNKVVNMLNRMNIYFAGLQQVTSKADQLAKKADHALGNRDMVKYQADQLQATLVIEMSNIEHQLRANDAAIATLQAQQSMLGKVALKGSQSLVGDAMSVIAFGAALNIDK
jgi:hypothetical protein